MGGNPRASGRILSGRASPHDVVSRRGSVRSCFGPGVCHSALSLLICRRRLATLAAGRAPSAAPANTLSHDTDTSADTQPSESARGLRASCVVPGQSRSYVRCGCVGVEVWVGIGDGGALAHQRERSATRNCELCVTQKFDPHWR